MRETVFKIQFSWLGVGLAAALLAAPVQAADATAKPSLSAVVSKSDVQVAEPFSLKLTVIAPQGTRIALPAVGKMLGEFDVIDHRDVDELSARNDQTKRIWTRNYRLETIATGELEIPAIQVRATEHGTTKTLTTEAIPVRVASVLEGRADPAKFRDIRSVVDVEVPAPDAVVSWNWVWWAGGGVATLGLCVGLLAISRHRQKWLTPAAWAKQQLEQLRTSETIDSADTTVACNELTSIVRQYLEMQFELSAPQQTSNELLDAIENRKLLSAEHTARFKDLFATADLAKFAGVAMTPPELDAAILQTEQLVEEAASTIATAEPNVEPTAEPTAEAA